MNIEKLIGLFEQTHSALQQRAARSVNTENGGAERAELYGKELIKKLSEKLTENLGKGFSKRSLEQFRQFYLTYKEITQALPAQSPNTLQKITQALPAELDKLPETMPNVVEQLASRFVLGWTHYVTLLTVRNDYERRFYEIEAALSSEQRRTEKTD